MARWIERRYPGAYFAPQVNYVSVAGRFSRGNHSGSWRERWVFNMYKAIGGDGDAWGDGLIPTESALLNGSYQIILDGVSHFSSCGGPWYGREEVIPGWWNTWIASRSGVEVAGRKDRK